MTSIAYQIVDDWLCASNGVRTYDSMSIDLSGLGIDKLPSNFPTFFTGMLNCSHNNFKTLTHLRVKHVDCSYNQLTCLVLPSVGIINCSNNLLTSLELPSVYYTANCSNNRLTTLLLRNASIVIASNNMLDMVDFSRAVHVFVQDNQLTLLDLPVARSVDCSNNQLIHLNSPKAITLVCNENPLKSIQWTEYLEAHNSRIGLHLSCFSSKYQSTLIAYKFITLLTKSVYRTRYNVLKGSLIQPITLK